MGLQDDEPGRNEPWQQVAIEAIDHGVMLFDEHGRIRHANSAAQRMLAALFTEVDDIADPTIVVYDEQGQRIPPERFTAAIALRQRVSAHHRAEVRLPSGESIWLLSSSWPATYEGRPAAVTTFSDVTVQKHLEDQLRVGEARLHAILDATPAVVYTKDLDGRLTLVNRGFEHLFRRARADLIGLTDADLLPPEVAAQIRRNDLQVMTRNEPVTFTERAAPAGGPSRIWASVKVPLTDGHGKVCGLAGVSTDITEQVRLSEEQTVAAAVVSATSDMIVTFNRERVLTSVNPAAASRSPGGAESLVGRRMLDLSPTYPDRDDWLEIVDRVLEGEVVDREATFRAGPMQGRTVSLRGFPLRGEGDGIGHGVLIIRDVTDVRAAEAEQRRLQEEVDHLRRLESLGQLAGGVAHDFNNLLGAINLTAELLIRDLLPGGQGRELAEQILAITARGGALTRQMLLFARREVGSHGVVDVNAVVSGAGMLLERTLGEDIHREFELRQEPLLVECDASQLEHVVVNLALNGRDALGSGGRLRISTGLVAMSEQDGARLKPAVSPGEYVFLCVEDNGTGMDAVTLAHAMEPFFTTKPPGQGTGLGLSTIYGVAAAAGGGVVIDTEPGRGTAVWVYLPRSASASPGALPDLALARPSRGESILVVEDSDDLRELIHRLLVDAGYRVTSYSNPSDARALGAKSKPDLLISDVVMPGLTGPELAASLRAERPGLRVLLVSGYVGDPRRAEATRVRDFEVLEKPFTAQRLLGAVRRILDEER